MVPLAVSQLNGLDGFDQPESKHALRLCVVYTLETAREVQGHVLPGRSHSCDRLYALLASKGLAQGRNSCWQVTRLFSW